MRLIDADAFQKFIEKQDESTDYERCRFEEWLEQQPTIEAKPVVHAHWRKWGCEGTVCSNCYGRVLYECDEQEKKSKYCPHCGAQMDEVASDNNVGSKTEGVKIPVIGMEDVPKLMEEKE